MLNNSSVTYRDHVPLIERLCLKCTLNTSWGKELGHHVPAYPVVIFLITNRYLIFSITISGVVRTLLSNFSIGKDKLRIAVDLFYLQSPGFSEICLNDHHKTTTTTTTTTDNNLKNPPKYRKSNSEVVSPHFIML